MILAGEYSFNGGRDYIDENFPWVLDEVRQIIAEVDAVSCRTKSSAEKTMLGRTLFSPKDMNAAFKKGFFAREWVNHTVACAYPEEYYVEGYTYRPSFAGAYRDMDFVKQRVGVEVQFGKYAFMVYNVCAKMTIFSNLDVIDAGIEIVPVKRLQSEMSTGVSYFEQFVWDLEKRGTADIDVPVLILGIDCRDDEYTW